MTVKIKKMTVIQNEKSIDISTKMTVMTVVTVNLG